MKWLTPVVASVLLCTTSNSRAQQSAADSLEKVIATLKDDTAKANRLNELVSKLQYANPAKAAATAMRSVQLSEKINYPLGLATAYRLYGVMYVDRMVLDSGKMFYDKAYAIVRDRKEKSFQRQAGLITHNYGAIYHNKQLFDSATQKYLDAIRIFAASGNDELSFFPYNNLATLYAYLKDPQKSLSYALGAQAAAVKSNEPARIVSTTNAVMSARMELQQYDSVLIPLQQNLAWARRLQHQHQEGISNNLIARYYSYGKNNNDSAVYYGKEALAAMQRANNVLEMVNMLHNIGYYYVRGDKFDSASFYLNKVLPMAASYGMDQVVQYTLENLVDLEQKRGRPDSAFGYMARLYIVNDSLRAKQNRAQVNELETKYETEKKDNEIQLQKAAIARKNAFNYLLTGGGVVLLIILALSYRSYRQKQKLQLQRINELEMEKQLSATEAILKGEEQERTRLAKDLHDGLGGMLSGVKYSLNTMKGNLVMTPDNTQAFERSMDMLDSSIREIRRVAHNMMPEALVKFGLDTALRDFCNDIDKSGVLKVKYQSLELENAVIDQTVGITIYRIVQELINNTIKHAGAANAIVQVTRTGDILAVTVEDDGKGFDTSILNRTQGIGWSNIQNRVEFLKGKMDVHSVPEQGTSVHIEINT